MFPFRMLKVRETKTQANIPPVCVTFIPEGTLKYFCSIKLTYKPCGGQMLSLITNGKAELFDCQVS